MFKALDSRTNTDIVILDAHWRGRIAELRTLGRQDVLVCPGCLQPVHTRAGGFKRPHFAHKHLGACAYGQVSQALLDARATLYEWLVGKFESGVSLEKKSDDERLPRPIDCWVEREGGSLAYWILDARLAPDKRAGLKKAFSQLGGRVNWVFVAAMLREDELVTGGVHLTTTEREFIQPSEYDAPARTGAPVRHQFGIKGTLHYLDADEQMLTTFRALRLFHEPQLYQGHREKDKLADVQVLGKTGEFVHPGEYARLQRYKQKSRLRGAHPPPVQGPRQVAQGAQEESQPRKEQPGEPAIPPASMAGPPARPSPPRLPKIVAELQRDASYSPSFQPEEATCILCGQKTTDWWYLDGVTKTCKCRECLEKGFE
ncbi:MAG: hypothetical protein JW850_06865 [Thermoflexales bacterium]|nr:hypothetical protein [Thermoflexales bacterium]